jgi:hypothetical protein
LKDALKKSAQAFVQPGSLIASIDVYYAKKRKGCENEATMDVITETKIDCPTNNVNSCNKVVEQVEAGYARVFFISVTINMTVTI